MTGTESHPQPAVEPGESNTRRDIDRRLRLLGSVSVIVLGGLLAWWALAYGAYFPTVLLPGLIAMAAVLAVLLVAGLLPAGERRRLGLAGRIAAGALFALAGWSALSAVWSPAPDVAVADGLKIAAYGLAFVLGACVATGSAGRRELALAPLALTGLVVAAVTVGRMLSGDDPAVVLNIDGTLQAPFGYRNAAGAFFAVSFLAAAGLAAARRGGWWMRIPAGVAATLCASLAILCQSRASAPALALTLVLLIAISPLKLRVVSWLLLLLAPAFLVVPAMENLYEAADPAGVEAVGAQMAAAGRAVLLAGSVSLALCSLAIALGPRLPGTGSRSPRANRAVSIGLALAVLAVAVGFVAAVGSPARWIDDRLDELESLETTTFENRSTRFGFDVGTGRLDFWRIALDEIEEAPLLGSGGGGFQYAYTLDRERPSDARDAHSFELEVGSELGLIGLGLILLALASAAVSAWRSRAEGWDAGQVGAVALAVGFYWVVHSSVDWFWSYPGLTAPVLATLGGAAATQVRGPALGLPPRATVAAALTALALVAIAAVPPFLSERAIDRAAELRSSDPAAAVEALDRASDLNPLEDLPLLLKGELLRRVGDTEAARASFEAAIDERPAEWAGHFYLAILNLEEDRDAARAELARARRLNPLEPCVQDLPTAVACSNGTFGSS